MPRTASPLLVLGLASLATIASMLVLVLDRSAPLWPRDAPPRWMTARQPDGAGPPRQPARDVGRRLPQLRGVVARQAHLERNFTRDGPDANNGLELHSETLTRFDDSGTPIEHVSRIRRADGTEVQTNYYSRREVAFRDAANRHPSPVGLAPCVVRADPNPGLLLLALPTLATPEELRAAGYRRTRTPALVTPTAAALDRPPTAVLDSPRVSTWAKNERYADGASTDVVVLDAADGRILASSYLRRAADGALVENRRRSSGPLELYDSNSFPTLRPSILDEPCD